MCLARAAGDADCEVLWGELCGAGPADDGGAGRGLEVQSGLMLIDDADKPAKWYFALKQARLDGSASIRWMGR